MNDDIIRHCVREVWKMRPEIKLDDLLRLELALRAEFGGKYFYIKKRVAERERAPR